MADSLWNIGFCFIHFLIFAQGQICRFSSYNADCRYRIDGYVMVHITATINYCNDPIDVSFQLKSDNPSLVWSHTFTNDNEIQIVPGYEKSIQMQVLLRITDDKKLWVKADFLAGSQQRNFMNERVGLSKTESCLQLNAAGKIALGCLIALLIIAGVLVVVLVVVRRWRRLADQEAAIIQQMEINESTSNVPDCLRETHDLGLYDDTSPVVRYSLPTIPEQNESSSDGGHVSIEMSNGNLPTELNIGRSPGTISV
ncbi:uncharacterized protein [Haliotis cracherodii]|uniref:uncharacterized protein n=1 Tax=Haliotis cracherodii TaxID=6455 RepID=UPI0039EB237B